MVNPVSIGTVSLGSIYGARAKSFAQEPEVLIALVKKALRELKFNVDDFEIRVSEFPNEYPYIELSGRRIYHRDLDIIRQRFWKEFEMGVVNGS